MNTFLGISVTAAILAAVLVVSCAPVPEANSRVENNPSQSSVSANHEASVSNAESSALDGDWVCASDGGCAYSDIAISTKEGAAVLNGDTEQSAKLTLSPAPASSASSSSSADSTALQLSFNLKDSKISASLKNAELIIGDDSYTRSPSKTANTASTK